MVLGSNLLNDMSGTAEAHRSIADKRADEQPHREVVLEDLEEDQYTVQTQLHSAISCVGTVLRPVHPASIPGSLLNSGMVDPQRTRRSIFSSDQYRAVLSAKHGGKAASMMT